MEIHDEYQPGQLWYEDEMKLVRMANKPILGICMGFEVIAQAYGAPITQIGSLILEPSKLQVTKDAQKLLGQKSLIQYEAHSWRVRDVPSDFEVLATSKTGVEMFRYKNLLATQFHPEKGGTLNLQHLFSAVI